MLNHSTFGAVGEESKVCTLYRTFEVVSGFKLAIWVATRNPSVP